MPYNMSITVSDNTTVQYVNEGTTGQQRTSLIACLLGPPLGCYHNAYDKQMWMSYRMNVSCPETRTDECVLSQTGECVLLWDTD